MNIKQILEVLQKTIRECEACCMDDAGDREVFSLTFEGNLRRAKKPMRKVVSVRKR